MAITYTPLATTTLSGNATSVTFSNIPNTYSDLKVMISARADGGSGIMFARINANSGGYTNRNRYGTGTATGIENDTGATFIKTVIAAAGNINWNSSTANFFSVFELYIPNYNSIYYKSILAASAIENRTSAGYNVLAGSIWGNNSAVNSLQFYPSGVENFVQYSQFTLYGITRA